MLMFYYKPYPDAAYQSIKDIHFVVPTAGSSATSTAGRQT